MKLPAEWEAIASEWERCHGSPCRYVAERCYTLANKPPKELTDDELVAEYAKGAGVLPHVLHVPERIAALRAVIAAHIRKQSEPERVKFRAARNKATGEVLGLDTRDAPFADEWEWLDYNGKPQSFEVVLP